MRAIPNGHVVTENSYIKVGAGYEYFPAFSTRLDLLRGAPKTDLVCRPGIRLCAVMTDGVRNEHAAWSQGVLRSCLPHIGGRFGFWHEVGVS